MTRSQKGLWLTVTVLVAVVCTVVGLSHLVTEPWHVLPDIGGDGAKNNLTYLYHSAYGKGYWFEGMNYPYGEHIVFTDGIPLLSVFFAYIGNVSFPTALATLWWALGVGYVLSCVYLYKLLLKFTDKVWYSLVTAILITFLTPQMLAIKGHYALSFPCVIPMFFYWTYMYHKTERLWYCVFVFLLGLASAFLHPYYAGMLLVWTGFYSLSYLITAETKIARRLAHVVKFALAAVSVAVTVMAVLKFTDPITDRPVMPYDPPENYTHLRQIFSSYLSPLWQLGMRAGIVPNASQGGEGFTYPGLVVILAIIASVLLPVAGKITKKPKENDKNRLWLYVALGVLLFSMGVPFIWGMEWLKGHMPVFRQFRALGRFSWIFYYAITVYGAVVIYGWFAALLEKRRSVLAYGFITTALVVWASEVGGYMQATRALAAQGVSNYELMMQTLEPNWASFLEERKMKKEDFQALLFLKFFHIGTEKLWIGDGGVPMTLSSSAALQLRLPIIDVMMSRSSWRQAQDQLKLITGPYTPKPTINALKDNRPFLLLTNSENFTPDEAYLLEASEYIGTFFGCKVYACYPDRIVDNDVLHAADIEEILPHMEGPDTCIGENIASVCLHFDEQKSVHKLSGAGALKCINGRDSIIALLPISIKTDSTLYEFSCWLLLARENYFSPELKMELVDDKDVVIKTLVVKTAESTDSYDMWFRASAYFYIPVACKAVRSTVLNFPGPSYKAMDEMLLRPADALVISKGSNGSVMVNGHIYKNGTRQ